MNYIFIITTFLTLVPCRGFEWRHMYGFSSWYSDTEFCEEDWIPGNIAEFRSQLRHHLIGQPLVENIVANSVSGHLKGNLKKALVLSFHGLPGIGKNYVANFLAAAIFKKGTKSRYFKFYNGRDKFPLASKAAEYKEVLKSDVAEALRECKRSLFVFDEVDMMPPKVIDALYPYMDYQENINDVDPRGAIFIFLSNRGGNDISLKSLDYWKKGVKRENYKYEEFRDIIMRSAFNEKGGLQHSDNINGHLISYYVPFLPLEKSHVIHCIEAEFENRNRRELAKTLTNEVLSKVVFTNKDSPSGGLYATSGCKNIDTLVATVIEEANYKERTEF